MGKSVSNIDKTSTRVVVDNLTGEIISEESSVESVRVSKEDDFAKLYLDGVELLRGLTGGQLSLLLSLARRMNYSGEVMVAGSHRREVMAETGVGGVTLARALRALRDKGVITPVDGVRGFYKVNPRVLAKGSWRSARAMRRGFDSEARRCLDKESDEKIRREIKG